MTPRTVRANFSSTKHEKWKISTKDWIDRLYERKFDMYSNEKSK